MSVPLLRAALLATALAACAPRVTEPSKSGGIRWVRLDDLDALPGPVVPHERVVLDGLREGRVDPYSTHGF